MRYAVVAAIMFALATLGCSRSEREAGDVADETAAQEEVAAHEDAAADDAVERDTAGGPSVTAAAPEVERPPMRNWVLLEFNRSVEPADLEWLEANGFRVDTVLERNQVRGWLERPEGSEVIARDPRIARISAQAR